MIILNWFYYGYMEEYFYDYSTNPENNHKIDTERIYIPAFWTNIQIHPNFGNTKESYNIFLKRAYSHLPEDTKYFTIVHFCTLVYKFLMDLCQIYSPTQPTTLCHLIYQRRIYF